MTLVFNILLAVLGVAGSLVAFGGETWRKGTEPLKERITRRGYIALAVLLAAFSVGIIKELRSHRASLRSAAEKDILEKANQAQAAKIADQLSEIAALQTELGVTGKNLRDLTDRLASQQFASIEAAFKLAVKIPRETDDGVVSLTGQPEQRLPSRLYDELVLYWGDEFHFVVMPRGAQPVSSLATLHLKVGDREYPLHDGQGSGFFERTLRILGSTPAPMRGRIENPAGLRGIDIKFFVRSTDSTQGQSEFKRLVLTSPFAEFARKTYRATVATLTPLHSDPRSNAPVRGKLGKGSLVRTLQTMGSWVEIATPEGRQGWVEVTALGDIREQ